MIPFDENGCIIWPLRQTKNGYGHSNKGRSSVVAHRLAYENQVGPIPDGLTLDHLCRNRLCVNPEHLEPVTQRENNLRGNSVSGINHRKTQCKHGHPLRGDNLHIDAKGHRRCLDCRERRWRKTNVKKRLRKAGVLLCVLLPSFSYGCAYSDLGGLLRRSQQGVEQVQREVAAVLEAHKALEAACAREPDLDGEPTAVCRQAARARGAVERLISRLRVEIPDTPLPEVTQ